MKGCLGVSKQSFAPLVGYVYIGPRADVLSILATILRSKHTCSARVTIIARRFSSLVSTQHACPRDVSRSEDQSMESARDGAQVVADPK
jgi:hypothetical protein